MKKKLFLFTGIILSLSVFLSYQNCSRVKFEAGQIQQASKAAVSAARFACEIGQTMACETAGIAGVMTCEATDQGPAWGSCIITPPTTTTTMPIVPTTTLPGMTTTTTVTTTTVSTTTTLPANNPCLLILNDVANPIPLAHGASYFAYKAPSVAASGICEGESRLCINGSVTGSNKYSTCVKDSGQCQLNGVTVAHNASAVFFEATLVPFGQQCKSETRTCRDRVLDGLGYMFPGPCAVSPPANCAFGSGIILHDNSVDVFPAAKVPYGQTCVSQKRKCFNGNLDGPQSTITQCQPENPMDCSVGSLIVPHGTTRQFAKSLTVPFGNLCEYTNRTCTNGVLSGLNFQEISCAPEKAVDCQFDGQVLKHGDTVTAFSSQTVAYNASCDSVAGSVTCQNGSVNGASTYPFRTCQPAQPKTCSYFGQTIAHNAAVTSYSSSSVPFLNTCDSVKRISTCIDGSFQSPLLAYQNCSPEPETQCRFDGRLYSHGAKVQAARLINVTEPATCEYQERVCDGTTGQFSGTFDYPSCTVLPPPDPCGDVVATFTVRTVVTWSSQEVKSFMTTPIVDGESVCSDNGMLRGAPIRPQTVDSLSAQGYRCAMPGLPTWYDGGRWIGWNYPNVSIDGPYKIVRVPGQSPNGYTQMTVFNSGNNFIGKNITFVQKSGESFNPSELYVCNRPPYVPPRGGGGGGGGVGIGGGGVIK